MKGNTSVKKASKNEVTELGANLTWVNGAFAVDSVNNFSESVCFFNLYIKTELGNLVINSCKVISSDKGDFISFPSVKGKDDKYHNTVYCQLSPETQKAIIEAVESQIG